MKDFKLWFDLTIKFVVESYDRLALQTHNGTKESEHKDETEGSNTDVPPSAVFKAKNSLTKALIASVRVRKLWIVSLFTFLTFDILYNHKIFKIHQLLLINLI